MSGYVKCENLSPMQILDNEQDGAQHIRMNEESKVASGSPEGKCIEQTIDEDIIPDESDTNLLEQSQVKLALLLMRWQRGEEKRKPYNSKRDL